MQSKELSRLATTDPLTGLLNRRELHNQAKKIIHHAARNSSIFAVLSIDLDYFKYINDTYGHQTGDTVLINLANLLSTERRANDLVARTGGEEFVLILADIDKDNSLMLVEKLRVAVENASVTNINITIKIGLVVSQKDLQVDLDSLLTLSDKALYDAKPGGLNRLPR
ncbi:GGDEF domain-containing protein [Reinekea sp.]|uniref:GGDEF domain-containing protein n=1 Tax=Reinekea sp. TaxID=1970455 RepID=UPI002A820413|nr:GGDEF domain-containing protein [Reinekea sp.]